MSKRWKRYVHLTLSIIKMPHPLVMFSQSDYLIQIVYTNSHINDKQCRSRSVCFWRSQLICIYSVCKGSAYPGPAGWGLIFINQWYQFQIVTVSYEKQNLWKSISNIQMDLQNICIGERFLYYDYNSVLENHRILAGLHSAVGRVYDSISRGYKSTFMEIDQEIISVIIFPLPQIHLANLTWP